MIMPAIADYRTKVLELLNDAALDRFTNDLVDEALLSALEKFSNYNPLIRTFSYTSTGDRRQTLPADFVTSGILSIEWVDTTPQLTDQISFHALYLDEQWDIEMVDTVVPVDEILNIEYQTIHTIDGLAGAAGTTIPIADEQLIAIGAAGEACRMRASSQVETNNLNVNEAEHLIEASQRWLDEFLGRLGGKQFGYEISSWADQSIDKNY
jgi:hypothetical protein